MLIKPLSVLALLTISNSVSGRCRRRRQATMDGSVILPLYVYPSAGAWEPVYDMYGCPLFRVSASHSTEH